MTIDDPSAIWPHLTPISGPDNTILIADREHGKLHVYDIIKKKEIKVYEKDKIGPEIYASYYSKFDANIYLGKMTSQWRNNDVPITKASRFIQ